jgi:cytidine deaminase
MNKGITFMDLYELAKSKYNPRIISPFIEAGGVSAAILTENNNVYTGVCIDTASTLGMCAERNAIANMITNGESKIKKLVCYFGKGKERVGIPCGACREYLMQLDKESGDIEILADLKTMKVVKLKDLIPAWWGYERFENLK